MKAKPKAVELVDDLTLFTALGLAASIHNHPGVIREIARSFEDRVPKRRRSTLIAIRKAKDPKALILKALKVYETPKEDLPDAKLQTPDTAGGNENRVDTDRGGAAAAPDRTPARNVPERDPRTGRWVRAGSVERDGA